MRRYSGLAIATLAALAFGAGSVGAQTQTTDKPGVGPAAVTVTPFVSLGSTFSSRVGAAILFPWTDTMGLEAEVGYRREELNALSAHLSVIQDLPRLGRVTPYLAAGIGLEQYGTAVPQPNNTLATLARTAVSVNAGGGIKVPVDARWFNGLGRLAGEHWRVFNGVTWNATRADSW
jgi:hypothetical protein